MAVRKTTTEKVLELMKNPENIRNICTSAHIDHGKCVASKTRVLLSDGSIISAEQLHSIAEQRGKKVSEDENKQIYDVSFCDINILSLNKETGRVEKKPISHSWKLKGGEMITVKTRNGFAVATTPEHKYLVLEDLEFKEKEAREISIGDRIVCARKTIAESRMNIKEEILRRLSKNNFYVIVEEGFGKKLKQKILDYGLENMQKEIKTYLKAKSLYHGAWKNRYYIGDLLAITAFFDVELEELYNNIKSIYYRTGKQRGKNSLPISLPRNFEDFFYLAGLFIGDGSRDKFVVGKEILGRKFVEICKELNIKTYYRDYEGRTPEIVTNATLLYMLNSIFEYPLKKKSHNVKISDFVFGAPSNYAANLLRGYFDCDGTVEKARSAISINSASVQMLEDLKLLLLRYGCVCIVQGDTLYISGDSAKSFVEKIGFLLPEKMQKAKFLCGKSTGSLVSDLITLPKVQEIIKANSNQVQACRFETALMQLQVQRTNISQYKKLATGDLAYIEVKSIEMGYEPVVYDFSVLDNKNFVAEGMIIHNTTFSDNLLAGAGMISEQLAGTQLVLDFDPQESARGITINAANVSMVHNLHNKDYLVNLIDTPGHVDFGGEVTKAMRAVDGTIVLVCAVEGIMPQTEAVVRQALRERVKPVLFINKVDRLIRELKLTPEQMLERFTKIINDVNKLIKNLAPEEYKEKWLVNVQDGSVSFGSAYHRWALNIPYMKEKGISLKDIIQAYTESEESWKKLGSRAPLHEAVLTMVIKHLPNPREAQAYRVPKLWHGELESPTGKSLIACDANGPPVFVVTKITTDQQAGEVATGRIFSGKLLRGQDLYLVNAKEKQKAQQLSVYRGAQRVIIEEAYPGNIVGVIGLKSATSGETCALEPIEPFEKIKHIFEAVVTKAIEAKNPKDLPALIEALRQIAKEDTTLKVEINHETGEHLLSGLGELHLEIWEYRLRNDYKIDIVTSPPVVVYRESITRASGEEMEGKSPNKHNKLYVIIEPLSQQMTEAILSGEIPEIRVKKKDKEFENKFVALGMDKDEAKQVVEVFKGNILEDNTRGQIHMGEIIELVMDAFEEMMKASPLAKEPAIGLKVKLVDAKLHEDSIHRGPAQIIPAMRQAMANSLLVAGISLQEPIQEIRIDVPADYFGNVTKLISGRRGQLLETQQEGDYIVVKAKMPVGEMFGFTTDLRAATTGRGSWFLVGQDYQSMPRELQSEVVMKIRQRKGLPKELPKPEFD